jgi:hypothetical protein
MRNLASLVLAWSMLFGCATDSDDPPIEPPPIDPPPTEPTALARCADPDVPVTRAWQVDNLHAPVSALTRAGRTVVLASDDGAVKTWILPADGGAPSSEPVYGTPLVDEGDRFAALAAAPPGPTAAIAGIDTAGRAHVWHADGGELRDPIDMMASGGSFVAVDEQLRWLVGGTDAFAGDLTITPLDTGTPQGPLATELWGAADAEIGHGGNWVTVGDWYGCVAVETRDPRDPATVTGYWDGCHWDGPQLSGKFASVDLDPYATTALAVGGGVFARFDLTRLGGGPTHHAQIEARLEHVVWLHGDDLALTLGPGADGTSQLGVWSLGGELLRTATIEAAIGITVDLEAGTIVTASADGLLRGHTCGE